MIDVASFESFDPVLDPDPEELSLPLVAEAGVVVASFVLSSVLVAEASPLLSVFELSPPAGTVVEPYLSVVDPSFEEVESSSPIVVTTLESGYAGLASVFLPSSFAVAPVVDP